MKNNTLLVVLLFFCTGIIAQEVHTSYLWHMQQPNYWPEKSKATPNRYQTVWESFNLKNSGDSWNVYDDGKSHPLNNLEEIFSKNDRVKAYQYGPKNSVQTLLGLPNGGAQVNYSGCLIENVNSLANAGAWGYSQGWQNNFIEAKNWKTSGGQPRMDLTGFTFHHALAPLISERALRMELQTHKFIMNQTFGGEYSKGFWPAECSFSERIIKVLVQEGFQWSVIANSHLSRTLNDYPLDYGTSGVNIDPPNQADKVPTNGNNWWKGQIDGRGGTFAAPYCYQAHKAQYIDPETGQAFKMDVVPMADLLSYQNGFSSMGTTDIDNHIKPYSTNSQPSIVLLAHDGDNAWGGGDSYYQESVPGFANEAASKGYDPTTIQQFLNSYPVPENDIVKVEDGSWVNAANDWGHPQFINWLWPLYNTSDYRFDPNGWTEDARNWAVITAAENYVITAEDNSSGVDIAKIIDPSLGASSVEKAWHFFLPSLTSGYMYYGKSIDMEVKQTLAGNIAIDHAMDALGGSVTTDTTPPSVFIPQRFPYNPGGKGFGPIYAYQEVQNSSDFHIWTFAYDVSGLASVVLKYRTDNDGQNPIADTSNETYVGGEGVSSWTTISMDQKQFPKGNITQDPEIDFFIEPTSIADLCYAEIRGLSNVLVDYYVEATDTKGNVFKTPIQHVYVGDFNSSDEVTVEVSPDSGNYDDEIEIVLDAFTTADNASVSIYYTLDGTDPTNNSQVYSNPFTIGGPTGDSVVLKVIAYDSEGNVSEVVTNSYSFGDLPEYNVYFKNTSNWNTVYVYAFDKNNNSALPGWSWPGRVMTQQQASPWYLYTIAESVEVGLVFTNGSGQQSDDQFRNSDGWFVLSENLWYDNCLSDCPGQLPEPVLSVNPNGGTYDGTIAVSLEATNNGVIYYTLDGSEPNQSSQVYQSEILITEDTTLRAVAYNATGVSNSISENYVINELESYTLYYRNTSNWNDVYVYLFNRNTNQPLPGWSWPGRTMSREQASQWYSYEVTEASAIGIVFTSGNGSQSDDLSRDRTGWFDPTTNQWYDTCPAACPGDTPSGNLIIRYNNNSTNWGQVSLYYWNTSPAVLTTVWPGVQMTDDDGDGWYEYVLEGVNCANVIFSNNGSQQTEDLDICEEGWYDNGWVSNPESTRLLKDISDLGISRPYPNPFNAAINFNISSGLKAINVSIRDIKGTLLFNEIMTVKTGKVSIPLDVAKGVYFLKIGTSEINSVFKIVK